MNKYRVTHKKTRVKMTTFAEDDHKAVWNLYKDHVTFEECIVILVQPEKVRN